MLHDLGTASSLLSQYVAEIRDVRIQKDRSRFRRNMERIGEMLGYELSKTLPYNKKTIQTPLAKASSMILAEQPVIAAILRAGIPLQQGLLNVFDGADAAFISAYRKHDDKGHFRIKLEYRANPPLKDRILIIADPLLATGASMALTIKTLMLKSKPKEVHIVTAVACVKGIRVMKKSVPEAHIWAAVVDPELNSQAYIVPGIGDAGDLAYGPKEQQ